MILARAHHQLTVCSHFTNTSGQALPHTLRAVRVESASRREFADANGGFLFHHIQQRVLFHHMLSPTDQPPWKTHFVRSTILKSHGFVPKTHRDRGSNICGAKGEDPRCSEPKSRKSPPSRLYHFHHVLLKRKLFQTRNFGSSLS